jgi:hypothetical protein
VGGIFEPGTGKTGEDIRMSLQKDIEGDLWQWLHEFITVPNAFYHNKFAPCPYAKSAVTMGQVDVKVWESGDARAFIREQALDMRDARPATGVTTRVMAFPPRMQRSWGIIGYVDALNIELVADNIFLNAGVAKTTVSRHPGSRDEPYFIVIANTLDAVLKGSEALQRTSFYADWPAEQYRTVVERRARLAASSCPAHRSETLETAPTTGRAQR